MQQWRISRSLPDVSEAFAPPGGVWGACDPHGSVVILVIPDISASGLGDGRRPVFGFCLLFTFFLDVTFPSCTFLCSPANKPTTNLTEQNCVSTDKSYLSFGTVKYQHFFFIIQQHKQCLFL